MRKQQRLSFRIIWRVIMDKPVETPPNTPGITPPPQPIETSVTGLTIKKSFGTKKKLIITGIGILALLVGLFTWAFVWYQVSLSPVGKDLNEKVKITIAPSTSPAAIGQQLEEKKIIRSAQAFGYYTRLSGTQNKLQAGTYRLSPAESTQEIVAHLTNGNVDTFDITFLPGATLADNRKVLIAAGYSESEVDDALNSTYSSKLFDGKPEGADLEGYIYGETYRFGSSATVAEILEYTFATYLDVIETNDFIAKFEARNLTLYEGITLASIIQRESIGGDEGQIAQVFYNRIDQGMVLGSDVTYQYIADKTGVARDPNLDSPYNTRRYPGLPPGPIAVPGLDALKAVADPAPGDYLFFLSGDDDVTYFGRTVEEHEQNIINHCKVKCSIL
jgi:UPF0755 protein